MLEARKQEILDLVVQQIETAGEGGFAAMVFFSVIQHFHPRRRSTIRAAWIGNLVKGIDVSEEELREVRDEMTPEMKARLSPLYAKWEEAMAPIWQEQLNQLDAENAERRAT